MYHLFFGAFPENSYSFFAVKFTYEETMLIALDYMANGTKYIAMSQFTEETGQGTVILLTGLLTFYIINTTTGCAVGC